MWTLRVWWAAVLGGPLSLALLGWNNCTCFIDGSLELVSARDINYLRWALEPPKVCWAQGLICSLPYVGNVYKTKSPRNPTPKMLWQIVCPNLSQGSARFSAHGNQVGLVAPGRVRWPGCAWAFDMLAVWFCAHKWLVTKEILSENMLDRLNYTSQQM